MAAETELLLEAIKLYETRAETAVEGKNFPAAKKNYKLAADCLLKIIKTMPDSELKIERIERAKRLYEKAVETDRMKAPKMAESASGQASSIEDGAKEDGKVKEIPSFYTIEKPSVKFDDIAGLSEVKEQIKEAMLYPFEHKELYDKFHVEAGGGILLYGLPGTGKTMLARAVASELDAVFFNVKCGALKDKYFGESEKNIRRLFSDARGYEKVILFFDEIDEISDRTDGEGHNPAGGMVNELLREMDGFSKNKNTMFFLAATNKPWKCDGALLRPGRFGSKILIPLPDYDARKYLVEIKFREMPISSDISSSDLAEKLDGASGADIGDSKNGSFFSMLKLETIRRIRSKQDESECVVQRDIDEVLKKFRSSILSSDIIKLKEFMEREGL